MYVKKAFHCLTVFFEQIVPALCFAVIFITFILGIFSRYVLKVPVVWTYEVSILGYMWVTYFGASYAYKMNDHVVFGLVYDGLRPGGKRILRIISNLAIAFFMGIFFWPATTSILSKTAKTGSLLWPQKYVFLPFAFMVGAVTLRSLYFLYLDLTNQHPEKPGEESESMLLEKARAQAEGIEL